MTLVFLALALSMDAFAAAISQGARARPAPTARQALHIGITFGVAQGVMPLFGWLLGIAFATIASQFDHWIAFGLLGVIGVSMIREGLSGHRNAGAGTDAAPPAGGRALFVLALATSIDAAAAGITLPLLEQPVLLACLLIGAITLGVATTGVMIGRAVGVWMGRRAEVAGGVVLIGLGSKILIEHLFFHS